MTLSKGTRVVIGKNGYDDNTPSDPYAFRGYFGVVHEVNTKSTPEAYYIRFEDPRINGWYGEPDGTTWPFYANELEAADA